MGDRMRNAYQELEDRFRRFAVLGEISSVLHWDAAVVMPKGGAAPRGEQMAEMSVLHHKALTDPAIGDLLDAASAMKLDPWQSANVAEMRRLHTHATAVPEDLVEALSKASSHCEHVWRQARQESDFKTVAPHLEALLEITRSVATAKGEKLGLSPYDALLDQYEPGGRQAVIGPVLEDVASFLPGFLGEVLELQNRRGPPLTPKGPFPVESQRRLIRKFAEAVGFDFEAGRIDESAHPFSTGYSGDHRITVSYDEADPFFALMAVMHECGHAAYEAGLPKAWLRQPVGEARGMGIHESQSLIVEMQACRSPEFLAWAAPHIAEAFGGDGEDAAYTPDNLYHRTTWVEPDFIRVEADEVTYPAHVVLRYRLETALLSGDLSVADLPGAWNDGMKTLLGLDVPDDRRGCLQDIHWYDGAIGYFPTYTIGAMTAAQLMQAARRSDPTIPDGLSKGDFRPLLDWLGNNIHCFGSLYASDALLTKATGNGLDPDAFKSHLKERYLAGVE